ncbi:MAG: hypothetical protein V4653_03520 [Pseudomonadota bacterium]
MNAQFLLRAADALLVALLWLMAALGVVIVTVTHQLLGFAVAMVVVLEAFILTRRLLAK